MLIIDGDTVRNSLPMATAVEVMRSALSAFGQGNVYQPPRTVLQPPQLDGYAFLKPAALATQDVSFGLKVITFFPNNPKHGIPAISGFVALFDPQSGQPLALMDGGVVTEIRTAAVSAVATDLLAPRSAGDLTLLGAGVQARAHLTAMAAVRRLRRARVWNHNPATARAFVEWATDEGYDVEACESVEEAVAGADLICTVTSSREPLLDGEWVQEGAHINAVGAFEATTRELRTNVVTKAAVVVDSREEAAKAAGDLLIPVEEGAIPPDVEFAEIGELLAGTRSLERTPKQEITVFESLGLALEDVAAAAHVVSAVRELGLAAEVVL
jgi:ornithine cyclodeaminase/alanine dehydrogenase-like protein (mu-crystallin family)